MAIACMLACFVTGCNKSEAPRKVADLPQANDENCKNENIAKLEENQRGPMSSACLRRGSFTPSSEKTW